MILPGTVSLPPTAPSGVEQAGGCKQLVPAGRAGRGGAARRDGPGTGQWPLSWRHRRHA